MSVQLQIANNSTCVLRAYSVAMKAAEGYNFLNLVLSETLYQVEALELKEAIKPREALMFIPFVT